MSKKMHIVSCERNRDYSRVIKRALDLTNDTVLIGGKKELCAAVQEGVERRKVPTDTQWKRRWTVGAYPRKTKTRNENTLQIPTNDDVRVVWILMGGYVVLLAVYSTTQGTVGA